jgi:hypothetical protein
MKQKNIIFFGIKKVIIKIAPDFSEVKTIDPEGMYSFVIYCSIIKSLH